jgi:hypothetical protein
VWDLQGILLYRAIEHRNEKRHVERIHDEHPYAHLIRDPRVNPEEAKKIAA